MNTKQIINTYFQDEQPAADYLSARLAGDVENAPPCVSGYQSEEHLADVLFTIYYQGGFSAEQKKWFWCSLNEQAKIAWNNKNADIFACAVYLYMRLGKYEADKFGWSNFINGDGIQWRELMDDNDIDLYSSALWLLAEWHYKIDWKNQFNAIVKLLSKNEKLIRPLNNVFNAIDLLDYKQWGELFFECDSSDSLRELLQQYLLTSWGIHYKKPISGSLLIQNVQKAVTVVKSSKTLSKQEIKIFKNWLNLTWPEILKEDLKEFSTILEPKPKRTPWQPPSHKARNSARGQPTSYGNNIHNSTAVSL